jgi:hypothetical protein
VEGAPEASAPGAPSLEREPTDFFFYSELLSLELRDVDLIGKRPVVFVVYFVFEARMPRP